MKKLLKSDKKLLTLSKKFGIINTRNEESQTPLKKGK